jgi:hypothetical protein
MHIETLRLRLLDLLRGPHKENLQDLYVGHGSGELLVIYINLRPGTLYSERVSLYQYRLEIDSEFAVIHASEWDFDKALWADSVHNREDLQERISNLHKAYLMLA